jgi:uncharacterized membrane protein YgcG
MDSTNPQSTISYVAGTEFGSSLMAFLLLPELVPGDSPSYEAAKTVYTHHPLGAKMAEAPVTMAQSQEREIAIPGAPSAAVRRFKQEFVDLAAEEAIRQTKVLSRIYGIATCGIIAEGVPANYPLKPQQLRDLRIAFNIWDPLNTAGSLVFSQNPNALDFLKRKDDGVQIQGMTYHPSRTFVAINERPIYLAWTTGAYGFVGRSVYQRAWYPLKSFLKTMVTDDLICTKAGVVVAKIKQAGSIGDNIMAIATRQKRNVVKEAEIGSVINIGIDEAIESLNLQNIEQPMVMARDNILKNCATAADMPAMILNEETFVEGFGEGTEDARRIGLFVKRMRAEMDPHYAWFDEITMHRAWSPEFYETVQRRYPNVYGPVPYISAFYGWKNSFAATWPNWLEEEDSEKVRTQEVALRSAIAAASTLLPISDPENQVRLAAWLADTFNDLPNLFKTPIQIDVDSMEQYLQQRATQQAQQPTFAPPALAKPHVGGGFGGGSGGQGGGPGGGGQDGGGSRDDAASAALSALHDAVERLPRRHDKEKAQVRKMMEGVAIASGARRARA